MNDGQQVVYRGVPWLMLATVLLAVAKVTGYFNITWWIVFLPMLLPLAVIGAILGIIGVVMVLFLIGAGIYFACGGGK